MAMNAYEDYSELFDINWQRVPAAMYIIKFKITDNGYNILVSDLASLYGEKLSTEDIVTRFEEMNSHVEMKANVILQNLKKALDDLFYSKSENCIRLHRQLICNLQFKAGPVQCHYEIKMDLLPQEMFTRYLIAPVIFSSLLYQEKFNDLQKQCEVEFHRTFSPSKFQALRSGIMHSDWLKGESIIDDVLLDSFVKVQNNLKLLHSETSKLEDARAKEKSPCFTEKHFQNRSEIRKIPVPALLQPDLDLNCNEKSTGDKIKTEEDSTDIKKEIKDTLFSGSTVQDNSASLSGVNRKRENSENRTLPMKYEDCLSPVVKEEKKPDIIPQKPFQRNAKKKKLLNL